MHRAWNKENGWCYYRCGFTFFPQYFSTLSQLFWNFLSLKAFSVGSARPVKFHQVSLSQSTIQLRKTSVMKISHSSSYLWTRTSMFTPSRRSYNQHWVLICPEGSSAWVELLSWVRVSLMGGKFRNHEAAEESCRRCWVTLSYFVATSCERIVDPGRCARSTFPLFGLFFSSFGMGDISYGLIIPIYLWTLYFTLYDLGAVARTQHSQSIKGRCEKVLLVTQTGGPHTAITKQASIKRLTMPAPE